MKKQLAALALALTLLLAAACTQASGSGEKRDTLTYISFASINQNNIDPFTTDLRDPAVMHAIFDQLVKFGPDAEILPSIAQKWEDTGEHTIFYLNPDAKFHDGTPVTADDVIFTIETLMSMPEYMYTLMGQIASWERLDDHTVKLVKAAPYVNLLNFSLEYISVAPKALYESNPQGFSENPVGCGPYKFDNLAADGTLTLKANADYFGGKPEVETIIVRQPLDASTAIVALETGEADLYCNIPVSQLSLVEKNESINVVLAEESWACQSMLALSGQLASDINLRKAIYHGVSRENGIKLANEGRGQPSANLFATRLMGELAGSVDMVGYDPELAREYLAKSNYQGEDIVISLWDKADLAQSVQADLKQLGIEIKIETLDTNSFLAKFAGGEIQLTIVPLGTYSASLEDMMAAMESSYPSYGSAMDKSEEYDQLIAQIRTETDKTKRDALVVRALEVLYDRAVVVNIYDSPFAYAINNDFDYESLASAGSMILFLGDIKLK